MKKRLLMFITILLLTLPFMNVDAASPVVVNVFYGDGCSYCHRLLEFLDDLKKDEKYGVMFTVDKYEVWGNKENYTLAESVAAHLNEEMGGVPFYVIGNQAMTGFVESYGDSVKKSIETAYYSEAKNVVSIIKAGNEPQKNNSLTQPQKTTTKKKTTTTTTTETITTTTTSRKYVTTYKDYITSTVIPTSETTKYEWEIKAPQKDKNGNLPEDIIKSFLNGIIEEDRRIMSFVSQRALDEDEVSEEEFMNNIKNSNFTYEIEDYTYINNQLYDDRLIEGEAWLYNVKMDGNVGTYEVTRDQGNAQFLITLIDGVYYIDEMEYPIELSADDIFGILKEIWGIGKEELGAGVYFIIPLILIGIVFSLAPTIIFVVVIVNVIKAVGKAKQHKEEMINQGRFPDDYNGQV